MHVLGEGLSSVGGPIGAVHDTIVHEGFEGGLAESRRSVVGGVGTYAGVSGEVIQVTRGLNDTLFQITPEIAAGVPAGSRATPSRRRAYASAAPSSGSGPGTDRRRDMYPR